MYIEAAGCHMKVSRQWKQWIMILIYLLKRSSLSTDAGKCCPNAVDTGAQAVMAVIFIMTNWGRAGNQGDTWRLGINKL